LVWQESVPAMTNAPPAKANIFDRIRQFAEVAEVGCHPERIRDFAEEN
jgi:hypothetical protein